MSRGTKCVQVLIYLINKRTIVKINCAINNGTRNFTGNMIANIVIKINISLSLPRIFQDKSSNTQV